MKISVMAFLQSNSAPKHSIPVIHLPILSKCTVETHPRLTEFGSEARKVKLVRLIKEFRHSNLCQDSRKVRQVKKLLISRSKFNSFVEAWM